MVFTSKIINRETLNELIKENKMYDEKIKNIRTNFVGENLDIRSEYEKLDSEMRELLDIVRENELDIPDYSMTLSSNGKEVGIHITDIVYDMRISVNSDEYVLGGLIFPGQQLIPDDFFQPENIDKIRDISNLLRCRTEIIQDFTVRISQVLEHNLALKKDTYNSLSELVNNDEKELDEEIDRD